MKSVTSFIFIGILLIGCSRVDTTPNGSSTVSGKSAVLATMSGQVFVVTKGRANIKLALVDVAAIPEKNMAGFLAKKRENGIEQQKLLMPKLELAVKETQTASSIAKAADEQFMKKMESRELLDRKFNTEDVARAKHAAQGKLQSEFEYFDSPGYYLQGLPPSVSVSKTDADGKFALTVPAGKYVIAAATSRSVFKDTEQYYWLVKVDASLAVQPLMLSNDNFVDTKCKECVLIPTN